MTTLSDQGEKISKLKPCRRSLIAVSLMHFVNDLHPTFLPAFLPALVKSLSLSLTQAGALNALFGIINLFGQPLAGHLADRQKKPYFTLWAPLFTAAGACLLPVSPSYGTALLFVTVLALGTSAFHPQGHGLTGIAGGETHLATYLSIFGAAGSMGAALSPLYAVFLAKTIGIHAIPFTLIPVAGIAFLASRLMPQRCMNTDVKTTKKIPGGQFFPNLFKTFKTCKSLMMISIVRDSTSQGIRVFIPLLITGSGGSIAAGGGTLFAFTIAGTLANLVGGRLADRFGKMHLILTLLAIAPLVLFPAIHTSGTLSILLFIAGGALLAASNPVTVAMAQELAPESRSVASSLVMGVAWGVANLVALPIGRLADRTNLTLSLSVVSFLPWIIILYFLVQKLFKRKTV
ncbi:MAG: MFS transporter [Synergistaceae bacterium]|nr:MFS transporter [Synergistaceae bacterium]MBP9958759.1 MFS transporter [Synergistaceae bacterium]